MGPHPFHRRNERRQLTRNTNPVHDGAVMTGRWAVPRLTRTLVGLLGFAVALPQVAEASLGDGVNSVEADRVRMGLAGHGVVPAAGAVRHVLPSAGGGEIREYVNAAGQVYAVRWRGPGKPDLASLLSVHFATFQADNPGGARFGRGRAPMVNRADLKIVTGGHPGGFWGIAWLPRAVPAGFDPAAL